MSRNAAWTEEDDRKLWSNRGKPKEALASSFGRKVGAIRARLKHLEDPEHKAYKRRVARSAGARSSQFASSSGSSFARSSMIDLTVPSPFATGYASSQAALNGAGVSGYSKEQHSYARKPTASSYSSRKPDHLSGSAGDNSMPSFSSLARDRIDPSSLNRDQLAAANYILSGGNAFLTGAAGVGKSYLLRYIIQGLRQKYERSSSKQNVSVVVSATTGIAATHVNGVTIHSWSGVRLGIGGPQKLVPTVIKNFSACDRWRRARVLLIDEISMIDGTLFQALDEIGKTVRGNSRPFGGIQVVLSGDFFQLPPVSLGRCGFAFECPAWANAGVKLTELTEVVRQSGDTTFVDILNKIRLGSCPQDVTDVLSSCHISRKELPKDGIVPTKLYCTNKNVDEENNRKLAQLPGRDVVYNAHDSFKGSYSSSVETSLKQGIDKKMPAQLKFKVGAQVIITRNMPDKKLVNGSRGVVKSFQEEREAGWKYPLVQFSNGVLLLVTEESVFQGGPNGSMTRQQLPLKLAWSLTGERKATFLCIPHIYDPHCCALIQVHKSQGMTIERAELQLDDAFDYGQVYVALSRVTSLNGLWIRGGNITQSVVKAHPKVTAFYRDNGSIAAAGAAGGAARKPASKQSTSETKPIELGSDSDDEDSICALFDL